MLKKIIISGGGTGGHIFPALAVADEMRKRNPELEVLFVGANGKMEMEKVPEAGYKIAGLPIAGIQRRLTYKNLLVPFKLIASIRKASRILNEFKPDVVIGVGGYASAATLYAASQKKIPILIQEQNSYAGITNKWLSAKAAKICVAYPGMEKYFPAGKIVLTGNPVRKELYAALNKDKLQAKKELGFDPSKKLCLITGGSLGAGTINRAVNVCIGELISSGIQVLWQTGKNFQTTTLKDPGIIARPFISDMAMAYAAADIVVARAGALTISEISLLNKAAILVPAPQLAEDHQTKNAMALTGVGAAIYVNDKVLDKELAPAIIQLMNDEALQNRIKQNLKPFAKPDAIKAIGDEIEKLER